MNNHFVAGILAGLVSALFSASFMAAPMSFAVVLACLAPLPILVVSLCWRHEAGLIAAFVSALVLLLPNFNILAGLLMLLGTGLPAWGIAYLILLGRATENGMEWYPVGKILVWIIGVASLLTAVLLVAISAGSYEQYLANLDETLTLQETGLKAAMGDLYNRQQILDLMSGFIPAAYGVMNTLLLILNVWLAAKLSVRMKRMPRPWPFIPATRMPPVILAIAFIGTALTFFLDGFPGLIGMGIRASSYLALMLQGLMFVHFISQGKSFRSSLLFLVYLAIPLAMTIGQGLPLYCLIGLGAADILFNIRKKAGANGSPPANIQN